MRNFLISQKGIDTTYGGIYNEQKISVYL